MEKLLKNKVMIVDDDPTVVLPIEMNLQDRGIETISFNDGEEALEFLKSNKVSVVLLDYHMEPHINGDEFIKRLREFDKETIVYLQTAYSEELPAIDMLEKYEIQGYIDKGKRIQERMQLIISALKQAQTLELVKEQQKEIEAHTYKEEFLGKFLDILMGEIKEKSFSLVSYIKLQEAYSKCLPEEDQEKYNANIINMNKNISELNDLIETLEIDKPFINTKELKSILDHLFHITCFAKYIKLNIVVEDEEPLQCDTKTAIYLASDAIDYLIGKDEKNINITIKTVEKDTIVEINNHIDEEEMGRLQKLASLDDGAKVEQDNEVVKITL